MKKLQSELVLLASRRDARLIFFLATIALYIVAAGAPDAVGGVGF
jgi:hypothetical protein